MSDSKELMSMRTEEAKAEMKSRWDKLVEDLQRERDEIRVRLNLARKEAEDELDRVDERIESFKRRATSARSEADDSLDSIQAAADKLWDEIRAGFERVRKSFSSKE